MSAPSPDLKRSECIDLGFLSVGASEALKLVLSHKKVSDKNKSALNEAAEYLSYIATGAEFAETGTIPSGFSVTRSMNALDHAMGPIKALRTLIQNEDIAKFFEELAKAVKSEALGTSTNVDRQLLRKAMSFFDTLYSSVVAELNTNYPVLGSRSSRHSAHV